MAEDQEKSGDAEKSRTTVERQKPQALVGALIERLKNGEPCLQECLSAAAQLRDGRNFDLLDELTEQLRRTGNENPTVRRLQAQSLIERGKAILAIDILESYAARIDVESPEWGEAHGLMGRAWKQIFFDLPDKTSRLAFRALANSIREYEIPYAADPAKHTWQGLNLLALASYVQREGLPVEPPIDCQRLARNLLSHLAATPEAERDSWYHASAAQVHLALGDLGAVEENIRVFVNDPRTTAFAVGGTLRELCVLWSLDKKGDREFGIVQTLRAALMMKEAGHLELAPDQLQRALGDQPSKQQLERILGADGPRNYRWWQLGLECAKSVGVICQGELGRIGTGFLVKGSDFKKSWGDELFVLTNAHVVSNDPADGGIDPADACVKFEAVDKDSTYEVDSIMWISGQRRLDAVILRLKEPVKGIQPLRLTNQLPKVDSTQRVYVIGYPGGGELSMSFQDNLLLDHEAPPDGAPVERGVCRLHYRAPTEKGSSGSPVFNASAWQVVALHHAGGQSMRRLNGRMEEWPANEGIWIASIVEAVANSAT